MKIFPPIHGIVVGEPPICWTAQAEPNTCGCSGRGPQATGAQLAKRWGQAGPGPVMVPLKNDGKLRNFHPFSSDWSRAHWKMMEIMTGSMMQLEISGCIWLLIQFGPWLVWIQAPGLCRAIAYETCHVKRWKHRTFCWRCAGRHSSNRLRWKITIFGKVIIYKWAMVSIAAIAMLKYQRVWAGELCWFCKYWMIKSECFPAMGDPKIIRFFVVCVSGNQWFCGTMLCPILAKHPSDQKIKIGIDIE